MEDIWKRIMAVIALSVVLPQLILNIGGRVAAPTQQPTQTPVAQQTTAENVMPTLPMMVTIPVLMEGQIMELELEDYVRGVVLAEMPASFEMEALKAQAIAARTYALRRYRTADRHPNGAICTDPGCCQAWLSDETYLIQRGTRKEWLKIAGAVTDTTGLIVIYEGGVAETTYFSCSGGRTESAEALWDAKIPYLQAVDSPGEEWAPVFSQELQWSAEAFSAALGRELSGQPLEWLGKITYTAGGGVDTMVIGGISYSGVELRRLLGLPSTAFSVTAEENGIRIFARGHGHRVGMSQYGAHAMAQMGSDFEHILAHYYPGTEIDKIHPLE